jgi:DHA1 family bicyclomycin/chloramphenicol resistance-like MFS transporter
MVWFWYRQPETLHQQHKTELSVSLIKSSIAQVLTHPLSLRYLLIIGLLAGAFIAYLSTAQQIFQGMYGVGTRLPAIIGGLASLFGVGAFVNSRLVERFGAVTMVRAATVGVIVASLVYLAVYHDTAQLTPLKVHIAYNGVIVFCFSFLFGNTTSIAMEPMGDIAGAASSTINSLSTLIAILVATLIGSQLDATAHPVVIGYLLAGVLALALTFGSGTRLQR